MKEKFKNTKMVKIDVWYHYTKTLLRLRIVLPASMIIKAIEL